MALIELEDTDWFPDVLRDQQLAYIGWLVQTLDIYHPIQTLLPKWVSESSLSQVKDLCSGSGEPMISLAESFSAGIEVTLSDKFPPAHTGSIRGINYLSTSEDIFDLQIKSNTYYTMFNAFHHFDSPQQRGIVSRMVSSKAPFCFAELLEPNIFTLLKVVLINTFGQLLLAPFVRPFSIKRLVFTYILPINLITTTYDGIISVLKSKTKSQYQALLSGIISDDYHIEIESHRTPNFNRLVVMRGFPIHSREI